MKKACGRAPHITGLKGHQPKEKQMLLARRFAAAIAVLGILFIAPAGAAEEPKPAVQPPKPLKFTKEFQDQVKKLPPEFIKQFKAMTAKHTRFSDEATLRQIMMELLSDTQCVTTMIMTENGEMAADCALRASAHRYPKGHIMAYVKLEQINAESLGVLPRINAKVEGGFERVAEFAMKKEFASAAAEMGKVMQGCVECHALFRFDKGTSPYIVE